VISSSQKFINDFFGQKVEIKMTGSNKGKITIPFHSEEDFLRIKKLLG
jgi:ParB family chromosome partitioning protein